MRILRHLSARGAGPVALTIGNFDGVHLGHRAMLDLLSGAARERRLRSCVMTFEPHPREFFSPDQAPTRLTSLREKLELLARAGIDQVYVRRFDYDFARISAEDPDEFARHVVALLRSPPLREELSRASWLDARAWDAGRWMYEVVELYEQLAADTPASSSGLSRRDTPAPSESLHSPAGTSVP